MMAEFDTNPGDRSVSELEREVDRERAELSATIDALRDKASVGNLVDQIVKAVAENGGDMSRNLGRTIRDNPLPALLTGVGLAWLMAGSGRPAPRYREDWEEDWEEDYAGNDPYAPRSYAAAGHGVGALDEEVARDSGPGLGDRASEAAAGLRDSAAGVAEGARQRLASAGEGLRGAGSAARHRAGRLRSRAAHAGHDARESFDYLVEEQPLVLGALALALGAAVGGALPRSRTEDRLFGAQAARARETFRELAEEEGEKVGATLSAMASEAQAVVDEAADELGARMPDTPRELVDKAADRLEEAGRRVRDAGAEKAERQHLGRPGPAG